MALTFKDASLAFGSFLGDKSQVYAAGLSAGVYKKTLDLRGDILKNVTSLGQKMGQYIGTALPQAMAAGAQKTGPEAQKAVNSKILSSLGLDSSLKTWLLIAGGGFLVWMLTRSR